MKLRSRAASGILLAAVCVPAAAGDANPAVPRIESVVPLPAQPHEADRAVIWFDDFDGPEKTYAEGSGALDGTSAFGGAGKALRCVYEKGKRGSGNRKVFFGDSPVYGNRAVRRGETFTDVYWRIYVRHQPGWTGGGPAKMSRATSMTSGKWTQAMIAHVWGSRDSVTLDPASGVRGGRVVTTKYNDFPNLRWLGNRPAARLPIHTTEEAGWWVAVESRARLNAPGKSDGLNQLWLDGRLEAERRDLDWRGRYTGHGINAVFLEAYWNKGSPVTQSRWYDNFVISTQPIGPVVSPRRPTLIKTPYAGPGRLAAWEVELAADPDGESVVWRSKRLEGSERVTVSATTGTFTGPSAATAQLAQDALYYARVRQQSATGARSAWSRWHQEFRTAEP